MKVLLTGQDGYIGSVMLQRLQAAGHAVVGMDTFFFSDIHPAVDNNGLLKFQKDVRDSISKDFEGIDSVIHLAALSNDPMGELNPKLTFEINHKASVKLASLAKAAGVRRFLYASTCSVYGLAKQEELATEEAPLRPMTPYAISKVCVEEDLSKLADAAFSPVYLRNATAYGWSPRFRADLVLNNLACWAYATGEIRIMSDGTPWRPIVHVQDIASAFLAALLAPRECIHNQAFNVGRVDENYQVRELAAIVQELFSDCKVMYAENGGPDPRSYRVDFSKIGRLLPSYKPTWTARLGVEELRSAYQKVCLTREDFTGPKYVRLARIKALLQAGRLDENLRWTERVIT